MPSAKIFAGGAAVGLIAGLAVASMLSLTGPSSKDGERGGRESAGGSRGAPGSPGAFMRGGAAPAVTVTRVEAAHVGRTLEAIGSGRAAKSVTLVAEATGLVSWTGIVAGARVKKDDVLLKLDEDAERIALAKARAQYPVAKSNSDRYRTLADEDAASKLEADNAFNAYKAAEADLKAAEYSLSQRTIRAPFDGVIGLTPIEVGDYLKAGDIVTTIDDFSSLIVEFVAPQEFAADVALGQKVSARLAGGSGEAAEGAVTAIDSRVDPASRTLRIEATFDNSAGALIPGATYAVSTTSAGRQALAMPGIAVQWDRTGAYVWKLAPDGEATRAALVILQRRDDVVIASGDIAVGDSIIVEGADRVRPGMNFGAASETARGNGANAGAAANQ